MCGWVKLHRSLSEWEWYTDSKSVHLFLHLLIKANHKESKYRGQVIKRGQVLTGRKQLATETGLSEQSVRTVLTRLKSTNEITSKSTSKFSVITVCNYDKYQGSEEAFNQQINQQPNQQLTSNQPASNHIQEYKKENNEKNISTDDPFGTSGQLSGLSKKVSPEQWEKYFAYSEWFMKEQELNLGKLVKVTPSGIKAGAKVLDNLIRVQGFDGKTVRSTLEWGMKDSFWQDQLRSLGGLDKKSKSNGQSKFCNLLTAYRRTLINAR